MLNAGPTCRLVCPVRKSHVSGLLWPSLVTYVNHVSHHCTLGQFLKKVLKLYDTNISAVNKLTIIVFFEKVHYCGGMQLFLHWGDNRQQAAIELAALAIVSLTASWPRELLVNIIEILYHSTPGHRSSNSWKLYTLPVSTRLLYRLVYLQASYPTQNVMCSYILAMIVWYNDMCTR